MKLFKLSLSKSQSKSFLNSVLVFSKAKQEGLQQLLTKYHLIVKKKRTLLAALKVYTYFIP